MEGKPSISGEARLDRGEIAPDGRDPLDVVTDLDVRAMQSNLGVFRGTAIDGILRINDAFLSISGLSPGTARGWDWLAAVHSEDRDRLRNALDAACLTGAPSAFTIRMQVRPGVIETLRVTVMATPGEGAWLFVGAIEPIEAPPDSANSHRADVQNDADTDPYQVLVDALPVPVAYSAPDGVIEFTNAAWDAQIAVGVDGLLLDVLDGCGSDPMAEAVATGVPWSGPCAIEGVDTMVSISPVANDSGGGCVVSLANVDASPAGRELAPSVGDQIESFKRFADVSPDYTAIATNDGTILYLNPAARQRLDIDPATEIVGLHADQVLRYIDASQDLIDEAAFEALRGGGIMFSSGEVAFGQSDFRPIDLVLFAIVGPDGDHGATLCIGRDSSKMRAAEQKVAERELWYRTLVRHSAAVVAVVDENLRITFVSPNCRELLGLEPDELIGDPSGDIVHPDDGAILMDAMQDASEQPEPVVISYRVRHRDGEVRYVETHIEDRREDPVIGGYVLNTRDVTEARLEVNARERSDLALRTVVRTAPVAIFAVDANGRIQLWNPACEALFGWSADEVFGQMPPFVDANQLAIARSMRDRVHAGDSVSGPAKFSCRDGSRISVGLSSAPIMSSDGGVTSIVTVVVDMTATERASEELEYRAARDRFLAALSRALVGASSETLQPKVSAALVVAQFEIGGA